MRTKFAELPAGASQVAPRGRQVAPQGERPVREGIVERESVKVSLGSSSQEQPGLYRPRRLASGTIEGDAGDAALDNRVLGGGEPPPVDELPAGATIVGGALIIGDGAHVQLNVQQDFQEWLGA